MSELSPAGREIIAGRHSDPFDYLGPHQENDKTVVRVFLPDASRVVAVCGDDEHELQRIDPAGLFAGPLTYEAISPARPLRRQRRRNGGSLSLSAGAFRFRSAPARRRQSSASLRQARRASDGLEGVAGVAFAVLAPNAQRVSVVGDFNFWDGRRHAMRVRGNGYWEIFVPGARAGDKYKYEIVGAPGALLPLKSDPVGFARRNAAGDRLDRRRCRQVCRAPGRRRPRSMRSMRRSRFTKSISAPGGAKAKRATWLTYRELAEELPAYVSDMGFTHVEFLPVAEHPFDGSWGYQPTGLFAPTSRFGSPDDFIALVDACHRAGLGVIVDWVPAHFPDDPHALGQFDGTALYEHANPLQGRHLDWGTLIYNFGRVEVANFLVANALFWLERYGIDGLRVDAVASMLYLDYSRPSGGWIPNRFGGRENLEAIAFLRRTNTEVYGHFPAPTTIAEESTAWPQVSRPVDGGGLGFGYKWNMGWMHDTLDYISKDPIHRRHHHGSINFGLHYAFSENFVLPLSHDEVVHGKRSILGRMPGDDWQRFANLRAYYGFMFAHPGKKLLFMGCEFAQEREWNHDRGLDWHLLERPSSCRRAEAVARPQPLLPRIAGLA